MVEILATGHGLGSEAVDQQVEEMMRRSLAKQPNDGRRTRHHQADGPHRPLCVIMLMDLAGAVESEPMVNKEPRSSVSKRSPREARLGEC